MCTNILNKNYNSSNKYIYGEHKNMNELEHIYHVNIILYPFSFLYALEMYAIVLQKQKKIA